jgi:hypothetical protein
MLNLIFGIILTAHAQAIASGTLALPPTFVNDILSSITTLLGVFGGYIVLIIAILGIAVLIEIFINAIRPK